MPRGETVRFKDGNVMPLKKVRLPSDTKALYPRKCLHCWKEGKGVLLFDNQPALGAHLGQTHRERIAEFKRTYAPLVTKTEGTRFEKSEPAPPFLWPYIYESGEPSDNRADEDDDDTASSPALLLVSPPTSTKKRSRDQLFIDKEEEEEKEEEKRRHKKRRIDHEPDQVELVPVPLPPPFPCSESGFDIDLGMGLGDSGPSSGYHSVLPWEVVNALHGQNYDKLGSYAKTLRTAVDGLANLREIAVAQMAEAHARIQKIDNALGAYRTAAEKIEELIDQNPVARGNDLLEGLGALYDDNWDSV